MTEKKSDPVVQYSPDEEKGLERHERMNNFVTACGVIGCPICNYTGPETPEASLPSAETREGDK